jgi:hypothetical protein
MNEEAKSLLNEVVEKYEMNLGKLKNYLKGFKDKKCVFSVLDAKIIKQRAEKLHKNKKN